MLRPTSQTLYHPKLPFLCNGKLLFYLYKSCANKRNTVGESVNETFAEITLTGRCVIDEVKLTVQKGREVVETFVVYEYAVTQYDPQTGQGGLFVEYIDTFLN